MAKTEEVQFQERLVRALNQRMYLLDHIKTDNEHNFLVEGSTSKQYNVILTKECVSCNCVDFKKRKKICKHIMFVACRIYKRPLSSDDPNIDITDIIDSEEPIFKQLTVGDCAICFESTNNGLKCNTCTNGIYHKECIGVWLRINNNCPMCRSAWSVAYV